jgi:hypothetical protein
MAEKKEKVIYNYELLLKVLERDGAKINENIELPKTINSECAINFICKCGKEDKKNFRSINRYNGAFCKSCVKIDRMTKLIQTNMEKYGVKNISQLDTTKKKIEETNLKKYGKKHTLQVKEIRDKGIETNLKKYGKPCNLQVDEVKERIKQTNMIKYGVQHILQSEEFREKIKQTNIIKYGVSNPFQSEEVKEKIKQTNLLKYGVKHILQSDEFKEKIKETNMIKYGVKHPMQNLEIAEKHSKTAYKLKSYILPSGKEIKVQGYENIALDVLVQKYKEEDIIYSRSEVPEIWWIDKLEKSHRYYVDFFIKSENKCIEIKSTWTYKQDDKQEKIEKTKQAVKEKGYNYELWIIDKKKNITVLE